MATSNYQRNSIIPCGCCKQRYAQSKYDKIGYLCEWCNQCYSNYEKGNKDDRFRQSIGDFNLLPYYGKEKPCFCCNIVYKEKIILKFECRNSDHNAVIGIECARKHTETIDSLKCKIDQSQLTADSMTKLSQKLFE